MLVGSTVAGIACKPFLAGNNTPKSLAKRKQQNFVLQRSITCSSQTSKSQDTTAALEDKNTTATNGSGTVPATSNSNTTSTSNTTSSSSRSSIQNSTSASFNRTPLTSSTAAAGGAGGGAVVTSRSRNQCRQCNGTRAISTRAGLLPCPTCAPWRQRNDYKPNRPLLTMRDVNLSTLDSGKSSTSSREVSQSTAAANEAFASSSSSSLRLEQPSSVDVEEPLKERKRVPMTEEKRKAIQKALQNRGPFSNDHRRRISRAMRAAYAANPNLRQAGKPKKCGFCGEEGHNRKTCPQLTASEQEQAETDTDSDVEKQALNAVLNQIAKSSTSNTTTTNPDVAGLPANGTSSSTAAAATQSSSSSSNYTCSVCGQLGHNKRSCPEYAAANKVPKPPVKMIIIEEVDAPAIEPENSSNSASTKNKTGADDASGSNGSTSTVSMSKNLTTASERGLDPSIINSTKSSPVPEADADSAPHKPSSKPLASSSSPSPATQQQRLSSSASSSSSSLLATTATPVGSLKTPPPQSKLDRSSPVPLPQTIPPTGRLLGPGVVVGADGGLLFPLPTRWEQSIQQAAAAVLRAWDDGIRRQTLELLLPQANSAADGGWPGGIRQQYRAALPLVESLLLSLKRAEGLQGRITGEWLDKGDCVGAWQNERLAAILFPTGDTLPDLQRIDDALSGQRLTMVMNPQWQPQGQIVSDFGFGRNRRAAERFIASFEDVYYLRRVRVLGDELRILKCYPGNWQVHYVRGGPGQTELLSTEDEKPTYERLIQLLKGVSGSSASKSWLDRAFTKGAYDEFASYDGSSAREFSAEGGENAGYETTDEVERDIVTGEVVKGDDV